MSIQPAVSGGIPVKLSLEVVQVSVSVRDRARDFYSELLGSLTDVIRSEGGRQRPGRSDEPWS